MSRKYKFRDSSKLYFISFTTIYWIDVFIRNEYKDVLLDSWRYSIHNKGLEVYSWCNMTSHIHMIIGTKDVALDKIIREMKSFTATTIRKLIENNIQESRREWLIWKMKRAGEKNKSNKGFQFWQHHNHPIELDNNFILTQKMDYIHNNPVVSGIVDTPERYIYSSARDYCGEQGLLKELILIE